ncbi:MAG TPA: polysaccharide deacetylase family protein [Gemmatimonadales bacterium]|nr:polysaccharide deacetylase family protein [Gemmatimonadales bacterium]
MIGAAFPAGLGVLATGALALGVYDPNNPLFGRVIGRGARAGRSIYLTFDDGPNPTATERVLDTLVRDSVPAAFFLVGAHVQRFPDLARRTADAGYEIGNHTQHHVKLHRRGPGRIRRELEDAHQAIFEVTARAPRAFRAPHGYRNPFVAPAARRLGYRTFGWTFGVWDTARPGAEEIRRRVRVKLRPGAIILLHDGDGYDPTGDRRQTAEALPGIIRDARDQGYAFRPLSELLA